MEVILYNTGNSGDELLFVMNKTNVIGIFSAILDGIIFFVSYLIATFIRFYIMYGNDHALNIVWSQSYLMVALLYTVVILVLFYLNNLYTNGYYKNLLDKLKRILYVDTIVIVTVTAIIYFTKVIDFSRLAIVFFYFISTSLSLLKCYFMRFLSRRYFSSEEHMRHVAVIGNGAIAKEFMDKAENKEYNIKVDGYIGKKKKSIDQKHFGLYEEIPGILEDPAIEEVVVALESHEYQFMPIIIESCERSGTRISIIPSYNRYLPTHPHIEVVDNLKLINMRNIPLDDLGSAFIKRSFDIFFSLLAIVLTSPLMLVAFLGIKFSMPGPVLFKQKRLGKNKKPFVMYKFRSMKLNSESNTAWSKVEDTRRTKFGKFIRKFSIDELPQLFNVLKGDMSLVGPRPELPHYTVKFRKEVPMYMIRNQVKPGMTGWAQVHGLRGDTSIESRVKYDIYYIENWSIGLDIKILFMTVFGGFVNGEKI